ncbi:MAG: hypothetical protein HYZ28_22480 [Myxococcales bacterium]|nr:hypothetical protein [Myxococcales bacterium]
MPAQILVMCKQCHRPQFTAGRTCVSCGAVLPEVPASGEEVKGARERLIEADQPLLEATLGRGRRILISDRQLLWHPGFGEPVRIELSKLKEVRLERRPAYEALIFFFLFGLGAALTPWLWLRLLFGVLAGVSLLACFAQRRYALVMEAEGLRLTPMLGIGTLGSPIARRIHSVWASVRDELERRSVRCGP